MEKSDENKCRWQHQSLPLVLYFQNHLHVTSVGSMVQWIKHLTTDPEVDGSSLTGVKFFVSLKKYGNLNFSYLDIKH